MTPLDLYHEIKDNKRSIAWDVVKEVLQLKEHHLASIKEGLDQVGLKGIQDRIKSLFTLDQTRQMVLIAFYEDALKKEYKPHLSLPGFTTGDIETTVSVDEKIRDKSLPFFQATEIDPSGSTVTHVPGAHIYLFVVYDTLLKTNTYLISTVKYE